MFYNGNNYGKYGFGIAVSKIIKMIIAIIQPTFLPWCGYMSLIDYVDEVILDNVQFDKGHGNKEIK